MIPTINENYILKYSLFCIIIIFCFQGCRNKPLEKTLIESRNPLPHLVKFEKDRILEQAEPFLDEKPITVTASSCERSEGGLHDFFSQGDYWWPDPENPQGPYIHRDGETNPDLFYDHRQYLIRLSIQVPALVAAYMIEGDDKYAHKAMQHLKAWFVDKKTKMNPHLKYAQAIPGRTPGRGVGIIDTIHLVEVAVAIEWLEALSAPQKETLKEIKAWFRAYLQWMTTSKNGINERERMNNHASAWVLQVAAFARVTEDRKQFDFARQRFLHVLLPQLMAENGSFPNELERTKPYGYAIFHLDVCAGITELVSKSGENLWSYETKNGRSMKKGMAFLYPYLVDKSSWPYGKDVMHWQAWPVRQPCLLFAGMALDKLRYISLWKNLDANPENKEVIRNYPIRQPVLWIDLPENPVAR